MLKSSNFIEIHEYDSIFDYTPTNKYTYNSILAAYRQKDGEKQNISKEIYFNLFPLWQKERPHLKNFRLLYYCPIDCI